MIQKQILKSALLLSLLLWACETSTGLEQTSTAIANQKEFQYYLEDLLLKAWYPRIMDTQNGGYISDLEYDWSPSEKQSKFIVSQSRGLWTAARALELYPRDSTYLTAAAHGFEYLKTVLWDQEYGGFHSNAPGSVPEDMLRFKMGYGNAFAIYALSQYAKVSKNKEAADLAFQAFNWMEKAAHDSEYGGYFNQISREGVSASHPDYSTELFGESTWGDAAWKDQNSSIHILEAFTTLYEVRKEDLIKRRLLEMFELVRDTMVGEKGYLNLNFKRNWEPVSFREEGKAAVRANFRHDHVSFGHDIETAYLLLEAAHVLGIGEEERTHRIAKKLVDHTLAIGFAPNYQGIFEGGYYFTEGGTIEILDDHKSWWAQIEALNALWLMADLYPNEKKYKEAFEQLWSYCKANFIDKKHGGWYSTGLDQNPNVATAKKASAWKTPYHTGRGLMNILSSFEH